MASSLFVLGGARSGKSRFAVSDPSLRGRVAFVATAREADGDMARRIARHRAERPRHFTTVEEPHDLVACLARLEGAYDAVVVDCLTVWVSNRLLRGDGEDVLLDEAEALAKLIGRRACALTLVSNEVGAGVHPATDVGLRFRDALGGVNQRIAAAADRVSYMVAGLPMTVKDVPPHEPSRETAPEAS